MSEEKHSPEFTEEYERDGYWYRLALLRHDSGALEGEVYWIDFEVEAVGFWDGDGKPQRGNLYNTGESLVVLSGALEWDGCSHLTWGEQSDHFCDGLTQLIRILRHLDEIRVKYMPQSAEYMLPEIPQTQKRGP